MRFVRISLCFAVLLMMAGRLFAQAGATGTILGTVTDASGAIVPNAKVTVTNAATNVSFRTVTSSAGDYNAPALNPGTYQVSVEAPGFEKSVTNMITLTVDQKVRVDVSLKPGKVSETLEVTAQEVTLDTDSAALSQLVSQQQVEQLPLDGRNFVQLLFIGAGAVTIGGEQGTMRQGEGNAISINGGRPEGNNFTLDGLVNTDQALETPAVILSQDAIQEFKVESGIYPAEYGFSASQVNIVSKGGTNTLHGSIFESDRNNAFDAHPFPTATNFITSTPTPISILRLNQFGFVVSGPVYLPKLYDGRNKTFFMANYEGWRMNNGATLSDTVPNPAVLQGDFTAETYPQGLKRPDGSALPGGPLPAYGTADCAALLAINYNCLPYDPYTGQSMPVVPAAYFTSRIGQVAVANGFWGKPTTPNLPEGVTNFVTNIPGPLHMNQQTYRGDQTLGKLGSIFGRYTYSNYENENNYNSGSAVLGLEQYFEKEIAWEVSHTISLGQNKTNNFRFGYLSANAPEGSAAPPASVVSALGEQNVFNHFGALQQTWPNVGLTTYNSGGGPVNSYSGSYIPEWEYADSFTWVKGRHTIGLGIDYRKWYINRNLDDDFYGDWGFSSNQIQKNSETVSSGSNAPSCTTPTGLCGTGNAVADMMLGFYSGASGFFPGPLSPTNTAGNPQTHYYNYVAPYAEDDWKVTPKLSISYGLRWDFRAATTSLDNHFFWLDTKNSQGGLCYADPQLSTDGVAPGVGINGGPILRYCGSVPRPGLKTPFAPRFGINYRLTDKTVIRGGYGIFFTSYEGREIDDSADIYPYSIRNSLNPATQNSLDTLKLSNQLFPSFNTLGPFPESSLSFIAVIESENPLDPYVQSWTLSVERELARNTTLEVNYVGTKGTHLLNRHMIAQPLDIPAASLSTCQQQDANGIYFNAFGDPALGLNEIAPCSIPSRLPYPNFNGTYIDSDFHGYSHYNAGNVKLERRAGDLALTAVYTWSKSMDNKSATAGAGASQTGYEGFMDNSRPNLDYGRSDFDVPQRFVASYVYELPFGRGRKFGAGMNRAADLAVGGWQTTGIATFQKGFPYEVTAPDIDGITGSGGMRASIVPGCNLHDNTYAGNLKQFFRLNGACFNGPAFGTYGNTGRNWLTQPGINNWDMGIGKNFPIAERVKFVFKADFFNFFNHHQYAADVGGLLVAGSGGNQPIVANVGSANFGLIGGGGAAASSPRIIQLGGKITF